MGIKHAVSFKHLELLPEFYQLAAFAQDYACTDPQSALVKVRCLMEKIVGVIYAKLRLPVNPNSSIIDKLEADAIKSVVPGKIVDKLLEVVISLLSGVFKPYAGVSTPILISTKGGSADHVWFYDVQADGFSLDDKRTPIKNNDLPDLVASYHKRDKTTATAAANDRSQKAFWVSKAEIDGNKYDLQINRYKKVVYAEQHCEGPKLILQKLKAPENEILSDLNELEVTR